IRQRDETLELMTRSIFWKYAFLLRPARFPLVTSLCAGALSVFLKTVLPLLTVLVVDYAYPSKDLVLFSIVIATGLGIAFLEFFLSSYTEYATGLFRNWIDGRLSARVFERVLTMPVREQSSWRTGDVFVRITTDTVASARFIVNALHAIPLEAFKGL